jgi:formate/nitrite transporter FocA (FNT family)
VADEPNADLHPEHREEPTKPVREILEQEIREGVTALSRPLSGLAISALSGGLDIGFSLFLMAVMRTRFDGSLAAPFPELLLAGMYSVGFIFVVLGRSELFTEHTTLAVLPVLSGHAPFRALLRLWVVVYPGNLAGAAAFAALTAWVGPALKVIDPPALGEIARTAVDHPGWVIFLSAILAGWLMGLLSWLVAAGRDTISQIVVVALIATAIGFCHLHHTVVGAVEVLAGLFARQGITGTDFGHFLLWTTLGNAVGGGFFVGFLKYQHGARPGEFGTPGDEAPPAERSALARRSA